MYVVGREHPHREPARRLLDRIRKGKVDACTAICPVILGVTLADTDQARDLVCGVTGISVRDAVHAAVKLNHDIEWIATFDAGFDGVTGVRRLKIEENGLGARMPALLLP